MSPLEQLCLRRVVEARLALWRAEQELAVQVQLAHAAGVSSAAMNREAGVLLPVRTARNIVAESTGKPGSPWRHWSTRPAP